MSKIDKIILIPAQWQYDDYQKAKQAILDWVEKEIIGEDEKVTITDTETNDFGIDVEFAVLLEHQKKLL